MATLRELQKEISHYYRECCRYGHVAYTLTLVDRRYETYAQNMNIDVAIDLRESTDLFVIVRKPVTFRQERQLVLRHRP